MGRTVIKKESFPEIVEQYNAGGKAAAYEFIRNNYGVKNPQFVIGRIRKSAAYTYDKEADRFCTAGETAADNIFMNLNELCAVNTTKAERVETITTTRAVSLEKLMHELISDRLLTLSRYIKLDASSRTILIDQTSLSADGYQIVTH